MGVFLNSAHYVPSLSTLLPVLIFVRLVAALFSPMSDCDEVMNYWEPLHMMLFGRGLQTWEYSPEFGLRSYFYLYVFFGPLQLLRLLGVDELLGKPALFYGLRVILGLCSCACEWHLALAVKRRVGSDVARVFLFMLVFAAGMFHATVSFLPQTFVMFMLMRALTNWMDRQYGRAIMHMGISSLLGWPFSVLIGIPLGFDILGKIWTRQESLGRMLVWALSTILLVCGASLLIDYTFYDSWVFAVINIAIYNSMGTGANLYGVEPWSYYLSNLLLNFNVVFLLAALCPLLMFLVRMFTGSTRAQTALFYVSPLFLWLGTMWVQPHKEERFIFIVYPFMCLAAALSLTAIVGGLRRVLNASKNSSCKALVGLLVWVSLGVYVMVSVSRMASLVDNYQAPLTVFQRLHEEISLHPVEEPAQINKVCIGKEWYRFPSHFFLPEAVEGVTGGGEIGFLECSFTGQLPQLFGTGEDAFSRKPVHLNGDNRQAMSANTALDHCAYIVDLKLDSQTEEPYDQLVSETGHVWTPVFEAPFLDAEHTASWRRALYFPQQLLDALGYPVKRQLGSYQLLTRSTHD
jgi:alpha-1,2-mannosyltransferase